jgi:hypothetical protein
MWLGKGAEMAGNINLNCNDIYYVKFIPKVIIPKVTYANFLKVECDEETHNLK